MKTISGNTGERLFLETAEFCSETHGEEVRIQRTDIDFDPPANMPDLIAQHKARYGLVALFCRPGLRVLDFPCGSGYASKLLNEYNILYEGRDNDLVTLEYARSVYGEGWARLDYKRRFGNRPNFILDDLRLPYLQGETYDVIACIEGIEHIEGKHQPVAISAFKEALKPDGVLVVSSPEAPGPISGPSKTNKWHKWELTMLDFRILLKEHFRYAEVELITQVNKLHTGETANCFYAVCRK